MNLNEFTNEHETFNTLEITTRYQSLQIEIYHDEGCTVFPIKPSDFDRFISELNKAKDELQTKFGFTFKSE